MTQWWFPLWPLAWALLIGAAGPETSDGDYRPARYGAQDVIGAANNLGSDIVKATAGLVQSGKVYSLAINSGNPFPNRDHAVQVERLHSPGAAVNNDTLAMWIGLAVVSVWRASFNSDVTFFQMAIPTLLSGPFMVMFFVPVTGLAIASVSPAETANAAGLSNFMRTLAGAFATSLVQTGWSNAATRNQTELAGAMTHGNQVIDGMVAGGASPEGAIYALTGIVQGQAIMLATINMFAVIAVVFAVAATLIWFTPKPKGAIDNSGGH